MHDTRSSFPRLRGKVAEGRMGAALREVLLSAHRLVGGLASAVPAARAARVSPMQALRHG